MESGNPRLDLHGKTQYQARVAINAALRRAGAGAYRLTLVHGYIHGSALGELIANEYAAHPRVLRVEKSRSNPGETTLVLRELC